MADSTLLELHWEKIQTNLAKFSVFVCDMVYWHCDSRCFDFWTCHVTFDARACVWSAVAFVTFCDVCDTGSVTLNVALNSAHLTMINYLILKFACQASSFVHTRRTEESGWDTEKRKRTQQKFLFLQARTNKTRSKQGTVRTIRDSCLTCRLDLCVHVHENNILTHDMWHWCNFACGLSSLWLNFAHSVGSHAGSTVALFINCYHFLADLFLVCVSFLCKEVLNNMVRHHLLTWVRLESMSPWVLRDNKS